MDSGLAILLMWVALLIALARIAGEAWLSETRARALETRARALEMRIQRLEEFNDDLMARFREDQ